MCEINQQCKNFINIISAHINNSTPVVVDPDWNEIIRLAQIHNLSAMLWTGIKDENVCDDQDILKKLQFSFNSTVQYSVVQEITTVQLINLLNKNEIVHILFKGFTLRELYPCKELRTMGDIDIVIKPEQQEAVHKLLIDNGYSFDEVSSHTDVRNYEKNKVCFEIHTAIVGKNVYDDVDAVGYFRDSFKYARLVKDFTYQFNNEHHIIYLLQHMAKHFKFSGCGVRMLLDIPVFVNKWQDSLNWEYIKKELSGLGLLDFSCNIFCLCRVWFGMKSPLDSKLNDKELNIIGEYILSGGVFGYEGKNIDSLKVNSEKGLIKRLVNLLCMIFPSYDHLKERYVWFGNTPKWLLPVGWVRFWWFRLKNSRGNDIVRVKNVLKNSDDANRHNTAVDIIGLKK